MSTPISTSTKKDENIYDIPLTNISKTPNVSEKQRQITIHFYQLSPGFSFLQLFLTALDFQYPGNLLLASQCISQDQNQKIIDTDKYTVSDIKKPLDLNATIDHLSQNVSRMPYFTNILRQYQLMMNYDSINMILDKFYDRNPNFIESLKDFIEKTNYGRNIAFKYLDFSNNIDCISRTLRNSNDLFHPPVLFYSKIGISNNQNSGFINNIPMKVLIQKEYFDANNTFENKEKVREKLTETNNFYYQIQFILGSSNGMPTLLLLNDECCINLLDNHSSITNTYKDIIESKIDTIYMLFYSIDENINSKQKLFKEQAKTSNFHPQINAQTDDILKDYINYKHQFWVDKEFNFIELIKESIKYPAFFGFCSEYDNQICFYGSVMLLYDSSSSEKITTSIKNKTLSDKAIKFKNDYNSFTNFALNLLQFLDKLGFNRKSNSTESVVKDKYIIQYM